MRRATATAVLTLALVAGPAPSLGHPGHGPTQVDVVDNAFDPQDKRISTGDTLIWLFLGQRHTVTADAGQSESFESDPGKSPLGVNHEPGSSFSHVFTRAGTYRYHCRVHSSMRGTITVAEAPVGDTTGPTFTKLSVKPRRVCPQQTDTCRRNRAYLRFTLDEAATVVGHIDRRKDGDWKPRRVFDFEAEAGKTKRRLRVRGLAPGRYRLRLRAFDYSDNASKTVKRKFRVRNP